MLQRKHLIIQQKQLLLDSEQWTAVQNLVQNWSVAQPPEMFSAYSYEMPIKKPFLLVCLFGGGGYLFVSSLY